MYVYVNIHGEILGYRFQVVPGARAARDVDILQPPTLKPSAPQMP